MRKVLLSADSTCDLSPELKERYHVHYYPFHVIFRGVDHLDNVDIRPEDIFAGYREDGSLPKTSAINVQEYLDYFAPFVEQGYDIVHLNLGAALSSAHVHAAEAARQLGHVYAIDSRNLSTGIGQLVIRAGRMIEQGMGAEEVARHVEELRGHVHSSFVLDTMDFLAAGGRCPQLLAYVGKMVKFHPSIVVDNTDGSMSLGKLYRGKPARVLPHYAADTLGRYHDLELDDIFITHSGIEGQLVELVRAAIEEHAHFERIHVTQASCTISSHCGPNTLGILFTTKSACA